MKNTALFQYFLCVFSRNGPTHTPPTKKFASFPVSVPNYVPQRLFLLLLWRWPNTLDRNLDSHLCMTIPSTAIRSWYSKQKTGPKMGGKKAVVVRRLWWMKAVMKEGCGVNLRFFFFFWIFKEGNFPCVVCVSFFVEGIWENSRFFSEFSRFLWGVFGVLIVSVCIESSNFF